MMRLTMDDHVPLRANTSRRKIAAQILDQTHVAPAVDQVQPVEVRRPGYVPVPRRRSPDARIFLGAAAIPHRQVGPSQRLQHRVDARDRTGIGGDFDIGR